MIQNKNKHKKINKMLKLKVLNLFLILHFSSFKFLYVYLKFILKLYKKDNLLNYDLKKFEKLEILGSLEISNSSCMVDLLYFFLLILNK